MLTPTNPKPTTLTVKSVTLLTGSGADKLVMTFELPPAIHPWTHEPHATMEITRGDGLRYIVTNLPGVETRIVDTGGECAPDGRIDWALGCVIRGDNDGSTLPKPGTDRVPDFSCPYA